MNTKLHAVTDTIARPACLFITSGQISDYTGAAALMNGCQMLNGSSLIEGMMSTGFAIPL